jgi:hypothetical protein
MSKTYEKAYRCVHVGKEDMVLQKLGSHIWLDAQYVTYQHWWKVPCPGFCMGPTTNFVGMVIAKNGKDKYKYGFSEREDN